MHHTVDREGQGAVWFGYDNGQLSAHVGLSAEVVNATPKPRRAPKLVGTLPRGGNLAAEVNQEGVSFVEGTQQLGRGIFVPALQHPFGTRKET